MLKSHSKRIRIHKRFGGGCTVACTSQGDSIIMGFHTPLDALRAALAAQEGLLQAAWPEALLAHPLCAPLYALPRGAAPEVCSAHYTA